MIDITLDLRAMATRDASAVADLFQRAYTDGGAGGWKARDIQRILTEGGAGFIAFAPGLDTPAGAILAMQAGGDMDIINIAVSDRYRRRSLGQNLLKLLSSQAAANGFERVLLEVADDNLAAKAFYKAMDFTIIGGRPGYYPRDGYRVEAIIMARTLTSPV
jgi:ribosomal-protein-alanine N-acetyltransferase